MPMKNHPHPGRIVRQDCLEPLGLTVTDAAKALGVARQTINNLVNEKAGISAELGISLTHPTPTCRFGLWRITREPSRSSRSDFRPRRVAEHTW